MLTGLHTIARLSVLAFAGLSLAALTAAHLESRPASVSAGPNPWEVVADGDAPDGPAVELLHRGDGRKRRVATPGAERWEFLAASPWVEEDGSMEAVGRFATPVLGDAHGSGEGAVGLIRVRLPGNEVVERFELEVMPTGRPAWDPDRGDRVIFPGATGRLYAYQFSQEGSSVTALEWRCGEGGLREPYLIDPSWSAVPELRDVLTVSTTPFRRPGSVQPVVPWWIRLGREGEGIVAAGPLFDPSDPLVSDPKAWVRYPVATVRDGRPVLLYLRRDARSGAATAEVADLEIDPATGAPRVVPGTSAPAADGPVPVGALVTWLDGRAAFSLPQAGVVRPLTPPPGSQLLAGAVR